jgi:predicted MPP superfamily phosphohydrolase
MTSRGRWLRWMLALLLVPLLAVVAYGGFIEPARLVVHRETIDIPRWPPALSGLRVALVADLHVGSPHWDLSRVRELVAAVNAEQPDLILLGGDYRIHGVLFGRFVPETAIADALAGLHAPLGVFCVLGNHDVSSATKGPFESRGLRVLEDEVVPITTRGTTFELLGMKDAEVRTRSGSEELALAPPGVPLLVLMHEPDSFPELDDRASLTLAAHTHGGQVRLPWIGAPIPHSQYGQRYVAGHVVENGRHLFVTTGLGTSVLPIRVGVPPEFALLTLRSDERAPHKTQPYP